MQLSTLYEKVLQGGEITREEALALYAMPLAPLCEAADNIRRHFCSNGFDLCTIINGKNGQCSENCRFCAQSAHYQTEIEPYSLLSEEEIVQQAILYAKQGVLRYSIVTSGRALSPQETQQMCQVVKAILSHTQLSVCVSFGLLTYEQCCQLRDAGVTRVHNNLETSQRFFPQICTTHAFADKVASIQAAQQAGLSVCSGGIMGLGEQVEDRIDLALALRDLHIQSVPINLLNPIPGTPLAHQTPLSPQEMRRIVAVYRWILPQATIRLAGGRGLLPDRGQDCFSSGANAAISGDMLTTAGITVAQDLQLLDTLGYQVRMLA